MRAAEFPFPSQEIDTKPSQPTSQWYKGAGGCHGELELPQLSVEHEDGCDTLMSLLRTDELVNITKDCIILYQPRSWPCTSEKRVF